MVYDEQQQSRSSWDRVCLDADTYDQSIADTSSQVQWMKVLPKCSEAKLSLFIHNWSIDVELFTQHLHLTLSPAYATYGQGPYHSLYHSLSATVTARDHGLAGTFTAFATPPAATPPKFSP
jgi:hypothetical protein